MVVAAFTGDVGDDRARLSGDGARVCDTLPELASLTFSRTMLLMAASIGGSLLQLPIIGWFTQIAVTAAAMHTFYGAPIEAATACGAILLVVTFLCIIPTGFIYSQVEHVSLKRGCAGERSGGCRGRAPDVEVGQR